jgi:hypothetical protein
MDIKTAKTLKPGMRVRVTAAGTFSFTSPGEEATLLWLDESDEFGDWYAEFDSGNTWFLEIHNGTDYEVIE